jgi:hypothetical protein
MKMLILGGLMEVGLDEEGLSTYWVMIGVRGVI